MKGKRPVLIYFCNQTDSGLPNLGIYSAVFILQLLISTASMTMIC